MIFCQTTKKPPLIYNDFPVDENSVSKHSKRKGKNNYYIKSQISKQKTKYLRVNMYDVYLIPT